MTMKNVALGLMAGAALTVTVQDAAVAADRGMGSWAYRTTYEAAIEYRGERNASAERSAS